MVAFQGMVSVYWGDLVGLTNDMFMAVLNGG